MTRTTNEQTLLVDEEIREFLRQPSHFSPLAILFQQRMIRYFSTPTVARNSKGSKARSLYKLLKQASWDLKNLCLLIENGITVDHLKQLKMALKSLQIEEVDYEDQRRIGRILNMVAIPPSSNGATGGRSRCEFQEVFEKVMYEDDENGNAYDEERCAKFVVFILENYVIPMIDDIRTHRNDQQSFKFSSEKLQKWKFTIAMLFIYVFPLRNSSAELITCRDINCAKIIDDIVIYTVKDSKRTSKLIREKMSKKTKGRDTKKASRVAVIRVVPIWLNEIIAWYIAHVRPRISRDHTIEPIPPGNTNPTTTTEVTMAIVSVEDLDPEMLYGPVAKRKADQLIPGAAALSTLLMHYLESDSRRSGFNFESTRCTSTELRSFYMSLSEIPEDEVLVRGGENCNQVRKRFYNVPGRVGARRNFLRYLEGLHELIDGCASHKIKIIEDWLVPPFRKI